MDDEPKVFVVCDASSLERGQAKAFSLSRVTDSGETRPFSIFVVRAKTDQYFGYVNSCPHQGTWLNFGEGKFFNDAGTQLRCGRHKAEFDIETGSCVKGPCKDQSLEPLALVVVDGEVCLCGVELREDDSAFYDDELDETMEITVSPD
jgi:nitrite reductase/ring-hydroxylating ferredoxin subunit